MDAIAIAILQALGFPLITPSMLQSLLDTRRDRLLLCMSTVLSRFLPLPHSLSSCLTAAGRDALLGTCMDAIAIAILQAPGLESCVCAQVSVRLRCQRKIAESPCTD